MGMKWEGEQTPGGVSLSSLFSLLFSSLPLPLPLPLSLCSCRPFIQASPPFVQRIDIATTTHPSVITNPSVRPSIHSVGGGGGPKIYPSIGCIETCPQASSLPSCLPSHSFSSFFFYKAKLDCPPSVLCNETGREPSRCPTRILWNRTVRSLSLLPVIGSTRWIM